MKETKIVGGEEEGEEGEELKNLTTKIVNNIRDISN
jgi:hypothetical protein